MDAWLFNLVMSYVLRYMLSLEKVRRGTRQRLVVALVAYADDVAIMGRRLADLRSAARTAAKWTLKTFGPTFKPGGDEVAFLSIEEEHRRRHLTRPAARGCPGLDIVGFVIRRTYTTVRRAIFRRARRQYLRAGREVDKSGTVPLFRAYKLASYYGYFTQTNSRKCSTTLRTEKIKPLACQVIGWATRQKERIHNEKCKHYAGPPAVVFERLPDGDAVVRLYDNIKDAADVAQPGETDPEQEPGSAYLADEVMFMLPAARAAEETQESIAADFSGWWKYGEAWEGQEKAPTVEERLAVMEDFMVAIMEG